MIAWVSFISKQQLNQNHHTSVINFILVCLVSTDNWQRIEEMSVPWWIWGMNESDVEHHTCLMTSFQGSHS